MHRSKPEVFAYIHDQKFCPKMGQSLTDRPKMGRSFKNARFEPEKGQTASHWFPLVVFERSFVTMAALGTVMPSAMTKNRPFFAVVILLKIKTGRRVLDVSLRQPALWRTSTSFISAVVFTYYLFHYHLPTHQLALPTTIADHRLS